MPGRSESWLGGGRWVLVLTGAAVTALLAAWWVDRAAPAPQAATAAAGPGVVAETFALRLAAAQRRAESAPEDTAALLALGRLLYDAHRAAESIPWLERARAQAPAARAIRVDLAAAYGAAGRWSEARAQMLALLASAPDDPEAQYNLGAIAANRGDTAEAGRWWRPAAAQTRDTALARAARDALARLGG